MFSCLEERRRAVCTTNTIESLNKTSLPNGEVVFELVHSTSRNIGQRSFID